MHVGHRSYTRQLRSHTNIPDMQVTKLIKRFLHKHNASRLLALKHGIYYTCSTTHEDAPETCNRILRPCHTELSLPTSQNPLSLDRTETMEIHVF
jgi:hypothetical protein